MPTQTASGSAATGANLEGSVTMAAFDSVAGNVLVAFVGHRSANAQSVTGVTYGGVALTQHSLTAGTFGRLYSFKLVNPASGTHDLVATFSAPDTGVIIARAVSGAHATDPCRTHNETIDITLTADALSVTSSTAQAGDLCLDCCQVITATNPTMTEDSGQANVITVDAGATGNSCKLGSSTEAMPGGVTMGWSGWTNLRCRIVIVPIAPAAGAGGTGGSGMMLMGVG